MLKTQGDLAAGRREAGQQGSKAKGRAHIGAPPKADPTKRDQATQFEFTVRPRASAQRCRVEPFPRHARPAAARRGTRLPRRKSAQLASRTLGTRSHTARPPPEHPSRPYPFGTSPGPTRLACPTPSRLNRARRRIKALNRGGSRISQLSHNGFHQTVGGAKYSASGSSSTSVT